MASIIKTKIFELSSNSFVFKTIVIPFIKSFDNIVYSKNSNPFLNQGEVIINSKNWFEKNHISDINPISGRDDYSSVLPYILVTDHNNITSKFIFPSIEIAEKFVSELNHNLEDFYSNYSDYVKTII